jgi:hypothetical protein
LKLAAKLGVTTIDVAETSELDKKLIDLIGWPFLTCCLLVAHFRFFVPHRVQEPTALTAASIASGQSLLSFLFPLLTFAGFVLCCVGFTFVYLCSVLHFYSCFLLSPR